MGRRFAIALLTLILWPVAVAGIGHQVCAWGEYWGFVLGSLQQVPPEPPIVGLPPLHEPELFEEESVEPESTDGSGSGEAARRATGGKRKRVVRGIRVPESTVLRLAEARAIPSTVAVPASRGHPAGLKFTDVSRLGVGLQDGDVLTRVAGVPALNRGTVISTVVGLRERRAEAVSAEFWRHGVRWRLLVEMPYPPEEPGNWPITPAESQPER